MKPFRFTLEAVRTVRQQKEQKAMELYAAALLAKQQCMAQLNRAQKTLDAAFQEMREQMEKGCSAAAMAQSTGYQKELAKKRDASAEALSVSERRLNIAMQKMLETRQQREVTDKFYDNQKQKYQREEVRAEQKVLDELAGRRSNSVLSWNSTRS